MEPLATLRPQTVAKPSLRLLTVCGLTATLMAQIWACSGVGPRGKPVVFGDQTNIVIWDEAHHTEHFIRNANFRSGADNFGFIAPTPDKPELHDASTQAFYTLAALQPQPVFRGGFGFGGGAPNAKSSRANEVKVIQEADVAGFHATTLFARSAVAINDWMNEHGYVSTPEVETWADRYTKRGWYLTAFKVLDQSKTAASTGTVRMSFKTKKPYNPFYVPSSNILANKKGTLRVYFVAVGDYQANIGTTYGRMTYGEIEPWKTPQWTAPIPEASSALLAKQVKIPAEAIPDNCQVETFVDNDFPRAAEDDIYFVKKAPLSMNSSHGGTTPTPKRTFPLYAISPLLAVGLLAVGKRRRQSS